MKKLAIIDLLFNWPPDGGARIDIKEIACRLSRDYQVTMFVPDFPLFCRRGDIRDSFEFDVHTIPFDQYSFNFLQLPRALKKEMRRFQPDYVLISDGWYLKPYLCLALEDYRPLLRFYAYENLCLRSHGTLFVDNKFCHVDYLTGSRKDIRKCIRCGQQLFQNRLDNHYGQEFYASLANTLSYRKTVINALKVARKILCYNSLIKKKLERFNKNVVLVPSGVDCSIFKPPITSEQEMNTQSLTPEKKIIFMPGRAEDPVKGFSYLRDAARIVRKKRQDFEIWFTSLGQVEGNNQEYIKNVGWLPPHELPRIYQQSRFCVVPSIWAEPFGIITLEAMACEKPVIVFNIGSLAGTVNHRKTGIIVPDGDIDMLANEIDTLLSDDDTVLNMGKEARKTVKNLYNWDTIVETYYYPLLS